MELDERLNNSRATNQKLCMRRRMKGCSIVSRKGTSTQWPAVSSSRTAVRIFHPENRGTFAVQMLHGAERVLRAAGFRVLFASTDRNVDEENRLLQLLMHDGASGCILVLSRGTTAARMLTSSEFKLPVVLMDRPLNGVVLPCITSNNYEGGWQAMEHLIELGHRQIIFLARPPPRFMAGRGTLSRLPGCDAPR